MKTHIVSNPKVLGGKPCIKETRIPVYVVLELIEAGLSFDDICGKYYPKLSRNVNKACGAYARQIIQNEDVQLFGAKTRYVAHRHAETGYPQAIEGFRR